MRPHHHEYSLAAIHQGGCHCPEYGDRSCELALKCVVGWAKHAYERLEVFHNEFGKELNDPSAGNTERRREQEGVVSNS